MAVLWCMKKILLLSKRVAFAFFYGMFQEYLSSVLLGINERLHIGDHPREGGKVQQLRKTRLDLGFKVL